MEIHQLRYMAAVARERHFQRAAESVHISQPTLSQQVKKLERELGVALFERSPRRVRLTPEGERFLPYAESILAELERATDELRSKDGEIVGRLRLAAIPTIGPYLLPGVIRRIRQRAPRLTLEIQEWTTSELVRRLQGGDLDVAVLSLPIADAGLAARSLGHERFFLAVAGDHPLARRRRVRIDDVKKEKLLILQEGHCFRDQSLAFCRLPAASPQVVFQGSSLISVMRLAAAGEGVTFVPEMAARAAENPGLAFVRFQPPEPRREIGAIWRTRMPFGRAHEAVVEAVAGALRELDTQE